MGISLVRAHDTMDTSTKVDIPILKVIAQACVVTWFNPQALIDGSMMLGAFRASLPGAKGTLFIIGVSIASMCWWLGLSTVVSLLSTKITDKMLRVVNVVCGIIIMFYGCKLAWSFIELAMKMFG